MEAIRAGKTQMSGREMFEFHPEYFVDDDEAVGADEYKAAAEEDVSFFYMFYSYLSIHSFLLLCYVDYSPACIAVGVFLSSHCVSPIFFGIYVRLLCHVPFILLVFNAHNRRISHLWPSSWSKRSSPLRARVLAQRRLQERSPRLST